MLIYASTQSVPERLEDYRFPVYRYLHRLLQRPPKQSERDAPTVE